MCHFFRRIFGLYLLFSLACLSASVIFYAPWLFFSHTAAYGWRNGARIVKASVRPAPLLQTACETTAVDLCSAAKKAASVCSSHSGAKNMGATQSTRPKVLVYGAPHAGKKSLVKALGDAEFELFTTDDGAAADAVVYVVDANQPTQWTVPIELLHSVNLKLGRTVPLCVVVNKSGRAGVSTRAAGSAPARGRGVEGRRLRRRGRPRLARRRGERGHGRHRRRGAESARPTAPLRRPT